MSYTNLEDYYTKKQSVAIIDSKVATSAQQTLQTVGLQLLKKQNIIGENDLSISMVQSLQESLDSKQNLLPETNALVIGQINKFRPNIR
jgi:hypothetical protein